MVVTQLDGHSSEAKQEQEERGRKRQRRRRRRSADPQNRNRSRTTDPVSLTELYRAGLVNAICLLLHSFSQFPPAFVPLE